MQELHVERTLERGLVGNVYLGKVSRVLPGMQSAFIDIGLERAAFCMWPMWQRQPDGEPPAFARKNEPQVPIEKQVFEGQALMVQVIKGPLGTKGARLSTQISIAGRLLVFLPQDDHVGVSQKIPPPSAMRCGARLQALVGDKSTAVAAASFAHQRRRLHRCRAGRRHCLPAQDLGAHQGGIAQAASQIACCTRT